MHERFTIQAAIPADHAHFRRFFAELGLADEPVPDADRWTREMMPHTFFVAENGDKVGYAYVEEYGALGYVRHVVVDPRTRGRGVGKALMRAISTRLRAHNVERWELNVKRDNVPAIRLYEAIGMSAQYSTSVVRMDWTDVLRVPIDTEVIARDVDRADEALIERAIGLPDGKIQRLREQAGQVFVQLVDERGAVHGFTRFDPGFPGAFPFRVKSAPHAGVMLRAMHAHRTHVQDWVQLVIEDSETTVRVLSECGARLVFEIVHYAGNVQGAASNRQT